ncbi:RNA polymerase II elongation factor ELL3 isoform 2-T2 [Discoglossus pictus]
MSRPGEDLLGTLPYRTEPGRSPRLSLYHLKLTDSALRCLRDFQRAQYIKIPSPAPGSDDRLRIFAFYLSRESKDKPQSSFECIRQGTSWSGEKQLSCIGSIQDKITVCATEESYQLTRDRMSQVEKETWSRTAIEIKPGDSYRSKGVKIANKNKVEVSKEDSPCSRRPPVFLTPAAKKCSRVGIEQRPLQEWLIHLLALKPHRKQDLILRLEKSSALPREQTELMSTLDMVGRLNPKDGSYNLREELFCQVQKDWMGYTPEEKQHMAGILSRKQPNISSSQNYQTASHQRSHQGSFSYYPNARVKSDSKRPAPSESTESDSSKKIRTPHFGGRHLGEPQSNHPSIPNTNSNSRQHSGLENIKNPCSVPDNISAFPLQSHKNLNKNGSLMKNQHKETYKGPKPCEDSEPDKAKLREKPTHEHKRPDRHKEEKKEPHSSEEEEEEDDWEEEALMLERCLCHPEEKQPVKEQSQCSEEAPDYFKKYSTITSHEQRQMYEDDFAADYSEYIELHAKVGKVLERFVHLGSKMKKVQQGTVEHKMIENKILTEYKKFKKTYPGYRDEKIRCEYLHHKLSHIKQMILEYEKSMQT